MQSWFFQGAIFGTRKFTSSFLRDIGGGLQPLESAKGKHKGTSEGEDGDGGNCHWTRLIKIYDGACRRARLIIMIKLVVVIYLDYGTLLNSPWMIHTGPKYSAEYTYHCSPFFASRNPSTNLGWHDPNEFISGELFTKHLPEFLYFRIYSRFSTPLPTIPKFGVALPLPWKVL